MNINKISTPCFLLDLDLLEENINKIQELANESNTKLWPMLKTHKSTEITKMQIEAGAHGVLCGTLDEAEAVVEKLRVKRVMLAYPVFGEANLARVSKLNEKCELYAAIDSLDSAISLSNAVDSNINFLLIYDSGLGRFGISIDRATELVKEANKLPNLEFAGICTHTGQVYGASSSEDVAKVTEVEVSTTKELIGNLKANGFNPQIIATGTTPTFFEAIKSDDINATRPGNYVFFDAIQVALGVVDVDSCALSVMATIVSNPKDGLFILDCGSKCLGLDKGAHGTSLTVGYGLVKNHPELTVIGLSEEVAKVSIHGETSLKVGDRVEIIPNHSCSAANMTNFLTGHRNGEIERYIQVDIRGNSNKPRTI